MNKTIEDALAYADTFDKPANKHMSIVMLATEVRRQRAEISAIIARAESAESAVPEEWIKVLGRLLDVFERCEAGFTPHLEIRFAVRDEARALLQTTGAKP